MGKYILKRVLWMIPIVLGVVVLTFTLMYFTPGDPASIILGSNATAEQLEITREALGLNDPYYIRLAAYLKDVFLHFDLGQSYITGVPIAQALIEKFPSTCLLALMCMVISMLAGVPLGILAATHHNRTTDHVAMTIAIFGVSMPSFWLALLLVILFSVQLGWLPPYGIGGIQYYILPAIAGSTGGIAMQARQTRSSMLEVIRSDFVTTARSKGVTEHDVIYKHALPNALIPIITQAGSQFGVMLGGTLILETIFSIPGIGSYIISAVSNRDYPVIQGGVIFLAIAFSIVMLLVDILYAVVDPRIRSQYVGKRRAKKNE